MEKTKYITTLFFVLLICSQLILQLLGISLNPENFENRIGQKKPTFSIDKMKNATSASTFVIAFYTEVFNYRNAFYHYSTNNFRVKKKLFEAYAFIQKDIFGQHPIPHQVIEGQNEWMFLGNAYSDIVFESMGLQSWEEEDKMAIKDKLVGIKKWCENQNIKLYLTVAPNKHTIHGEYLSIKKSLKPTKIKTLKTFLAAYDMNLIDMSETLLEHNQKQLYYKGDSHWNKLGAFWGYKQLISEIEKDFPEIKGFELTDYDLGKELRRKNDLHTLLLDTTGEYSVKLISKNPPTGRVVEKKSDKHSRFINDSKRLKAIVFCDSFITNMRLYLKEHFSETVFVRNMKFNKNLINREKPDIIIIEIIERNLDDLIIL